MTSPLEPTILTRCCDCRERPPMPAALRCLRCFHSWLDDTKGRMRGTSQANIRGDGHEAVRTVRLPPWTRGGAA